MPVRRKSAPDGGPPSISLPPALEEDDEELTQSSEDESASVAALDADDSMFQPATPNRLLSAVPGLVTRRASGVTPAPVKSGIKNSANNSNGRYEENTRRSSRRSSGRGGVGAPATARTPDAGNRSLGTAEGRPSSEDVPMQGHDSPAPPALDGETRKEKRSRQSSPERADNSSQITEHVPGDAEERGSPTKRLRVSASTNPSPAQESSEGASDEDGDVTQGSNGGKGKGRREPSPEPHIADEERGHFDVVRGDEVEAENIRAAMEASLQELRGRERVGESSASGMTCQTEMASSSATPTLTQADTASASVPGPRPSTPTPNALVSGPQLSTPGSRSSTSTPASSPGDFLSTAGPLTPGGQSPGSQARAPVSPAVAGSSPASPSPSGRRTFAAARLQISGVQSRPLTSAQSTHDPNEFRLRELPARCQVDNPRLQDELLRDFYQNLPCLILGAFISWSQLRGSGQFPFSHWGDVAPAMIFENALAFINFVASGRYINPARASPLLVRALRRTVNGFRMDLYVENEPAILLSTMYVRQSHLLTPPPRGLRQHLIAGIGHTQEWERQVSFICMAFGQAELHAQLSADVLTYSTRSDTSRSYTSPTGQFSSTPSPSTRVAARAFQLSAGDSMSLSFNETVPVYDARTAAVDLSDVESLFNLLWSVRSD